MFQKHNEGMNWKKFNLARDCWLLLVGFPADLRCMAELNNAVSSFGKLLSWDRAKSTEAAVVIKVRIDALKDIPISLAVTGDVHFQGESWTCPVIIFQEELIGEGPAEEDPIPVDENPHPRPPEQHHHPNQFNLFLGPIPQHQPDNHNDNQQDQQANEVDQLEEEEDWDHWAMPPAQNENVNVEVQAGEFLELNDFMGPMNVEDVQHMAEDGSGITLSLGLPENSISSAESVRGGVNLQIFGDLLAPIVPPAPQLPLEERLFDLNMPVIEAVQPFQPKINVLMLDLNHDEEAQALSNQSVLPLGNVVTNKLGSSNVAAGLDQILLVVGQITAPGSVPVLPEVQQTVVTSSEILLQNQQVEVAVVKENLLQENALSNVHQSGFTQIEGTFVQGGSDTVIAKKEAFLGDNIVIADKEDSFPVAPQKKVPAAETSDADSGSSAPPGFPIPCYLDPVQVGAVNLTHDVADPVMKELLQSQTLHQLDGVGLSKEQAQLWQKHFAPSADSDKVAQVPVEWINFIAMALLSPNRFEWAKKLLNSQLWKVIT